jgi:hypothetical protein
VKAKPARAFMNRLKDGDIQLLSTEELDRFEKLCDLINKKNDGPQLKEHPTALSPRLD